MVFIAAVKNMGLALWVCSFDSSDQMWLFLSYTFGYISLQQCAEMSPQNHL